MHCEAMIPVNDTWTRCGRTPTDLHHKLTRARGGSELDKLGETYHHMRLCREHHGVAHDQYTAFENGLLIDGYFMLGVYYGSDPYLKEKYKED